MKKYLLAFLLSLSGASHAGDYGAGHSLVLFYFDKAARDINHFIFDEHTDFAQGLSDVETAGLALYFCYQEKKSRGTKNITQWDDLTGSYDSTMDCLLPLAVAGRTIYLSRSGDPMISFFDIKW